MERTRDLIEMWVYSDESPQDVCLNVMKRVLSQLETKLGYTEENEPEYPALKAQHEAFTTYLEQFKRNKAMVTKLNSNQYPMLTRLMANEEDASKLKHVQELFKNVDALNKKLKEENDALMDKKRKEWAEEDKTEDKVESLRDTENEPDDDGGDDELTFRVDWLKNPITEAQFDSISKFYTKQWRKGHIRWFDKSSGEGVVRMDEGPLKDFSITVHGSAFGGDVNFGQNTAFEPKEKMPVKVQLWVDTTYLMVEKMEQDKNATVEARENGFVKNIRHKGHDISILQDGKGFVFQLDGKKHDNGGKGWKSADEAMTAIKEYVQVNKKSLNEVEAAADDDMLAGYLTTALWSSMDNSNDQGGDPLDANYDTDDIDPETIEKADKDCAAFIQKAGALLDGLNMGTVGHDFWLTRNGHGAGFWDGDYEKEVGEALTKISKEFGEVDLYVGDDGKIHSSLETESAKKKWIVKDWAGNIVKMPKANYPSFEDAWGALYEIHDKLPEDEFDEMMGEFEVVEE